VPSSFLHRLLVDLGLRSSSPDDSNVVREERDGQAGCSPGGQVERGSATGRQLSIAFEAAPLHGISSPDRAKVLIHLASLLLQALGANVGERDDGER